MPDSIMAGDTPCLRHAPSVAPSPPLPKMVAVHLPQRGSTPRDPSYAPAMTVTRFDNPGLLVPGRAAFTVRRGRGFSSSCGLRVRSSRCNKNGYGTLPAGSQTRFSGLTGPLTPRGLMSHHENRGDSRVDAAPPASWASGRFRTRAAHQTNPGNAAERPGAGAPHPRRCGQPRRAATHASHV